MSKEEGYSSASFWQLFIAIPGAILGFTLLLSLLANFAKTSSEAAPAAPAVAAVAVADTAPAAEPAPAAAAEQPATPPTEPQNDNITPAAVIEVAPAPGTVAEKSGEEVVKGVCSMCHAAGLMESPKIGDKGQWAPRIAQGYETLVQHAIQGYKNMPARGGNPDLTDGEIAKAVAHMANQAGANFDPASIKK